MHTPKQIALGLVGALALLLTPGVAHAQYDFSPQLFGTYTRPIIIGWQLAGRDLNGVALGGKLLDGRRVTNVSLRGATFKGARVRKVWLWRGELRAITRSWRFLRGTRARGLAFRASLDNGGSVALRVEGVTTGDQVQTRDVHLYSVSYRTARGWKPLCGYDAQGVEVLATALEGRWDYSQGTATGGAHVRDPRRFTFGCEDSALGKCVLMGYAPWRRVLTRTGCKGKAWWTCKVKVTSLRHHHQACTRMLRADYCGDGTPHTVDKVAINVFDGLGVRVDSEAWPLEAEWNQGGALCVSHTRIQVAHPSCWNQLYDASCGDPATFDKKMLLISEYKPLP